MEYIGKHKLTGKEIYKINDKHYCLEDGKFIKIEELSDKQKQMLSVLHKYGTEIKY